MGNSQSAIAKSSSPHEKEIKEVFRVSFVSYNNKRKVTGKNENEKEASLFTGLVDSLCH